VSDPLHRTGYFVIVATAVLLTCVNPIRSYAQGTNINLDPRVMISLAHDSAVEFVQFSKSGMLLLSLARDRPIKLWEINSGRLLRELGSRVNCATFSRDGARILAAESSGMVSEWDVETGVRLQYFGKMEFAFSCRITLSLDETYVLAEGSSNSSDYTAEVWKRKSGSRVQARHGRIEYGFDATRETDSTVTIVRVDNADGEVWDLHSGKVLKKFDPGQGVIRSANGQKVLDWLTTEPITVRDVSSDSKTDLQGSVRGFEPTFSVDGKWIAGAAENYHLGVWNASTGQLTWNLEDPFYPYRDSGHFSANGTRLIELNRGGRSAAQLWDLDKGALLRTFPGVKTAEFSAGGELLALGSYTGELRVIDSRTGSVRVTMGSVFPISRSISFSQDSKKFVVPSLDGRLTVWDSQKGVRLQVISTDERDLTQLSGTEFEELGFVDGDWAPQVMFLADGKQLLSDDSGSTRIWDIQSGRVVRDLGYRVGSRLGLSSDGKVFVSANLEELHKLGLALTRTKTPTLLENSPEQEIMPGTVATEFIMPDEQRSMPLTMVDAHDGHQLRQFTLPQTSKSNENLAALSMDGSMVISLQRADASKSVFDDGNWLDIHVWNIPKRGADQYTDTRLTMFRSFSTNAQWLSGVTFSRDGKLVAAGGNNGFLRLWNLQSGLDVCSFPAGDGDITALALAPDGTRLITQGPGPQVRIWNTRDCALLATMISHFKYGWITITPGGFLVGSGKTVRGVSVVRGIESVSLDEVYEHLYRPDLVEEALKGDPQGKYKNALFGLNLAQMMNSGPPPQIEILYRRTDVAGNSARLKVRVTDSGGGIGRRLIWRVNNAAQGLIEPPELSGRDQPFVGSAVIIDQSLEFDRGQYNDIEVTAYNGKGLLASNSSFSLNADGASPGPRSMFVLAVGVNHYREKDLQLTVAAEDAEAVGVAFRAVAKEPIFAKTDVKVLQNEEVTRDAIEKQFKRIATEIGPRDVFVLYLAGHGASVAGEYFYLPQNIDFAAGQSVSIDGIGTEQWLNWLALLKVDKRLLLLDTCNAGAAGTLIRGGDSEQKAAVERLEMATGDSLIAAARAGNPAFEGYRGHGIMTYALLEAMDKSKDDRQTNVVRVGEVADHIDDRVPELSRLIVGISQIPIRKVNGNDFPIGLRSVVLTDTDGLANVRATHVLVRKEVVRSEPNSGSARGVALEPGTQVYVVKFFGNWALVARKGSKIGYIPAESIAVLQ
jgi:WD40 repeat protein